VLPLGEPECEDPALLERPGRLLLELLVSAHPDRAQTENRDLPRVPVSEPVEGDDLVELAVAVGVPARVRIVAIPGRGEQGGEYLVLLDEVEILPIPDLLPVVLPDTRQPLLLEELERLQHDLAGLLVRILANVFLGVQEDHGCGSLFPVLNLDSYITR
jgi:hypothetical protein